MPYKVGDYVRVLDAVIDSDMIGKIVRVRMVEDDRVWLDGSRGSWNQDSSKLELRNFRVGDRVRCIFSPVSDQEYVGDIVTISEMDGDEITKIKEWKYPWSYSNDWFELVTPVEETTTQTTASLAPFLSGYFHKEPPHPFKVGDRVRIIDRLDLDYGKEGVIVNNDGDTEGELPWEVIFSEFDSGNFNAEDMELVPDYKPSKKEGLMTKLSRLAKTHLDKDIKAMVEAGYLFENLTLTDAGRDALTSLALNDYKEEMGKLAREEIKERKEDC